MIDTLQQDPSIIQITIVMISLIAVAIWRKLYKAATTMAGIYVIYILFIIISVPTPKEIPTEESQSTNAQLPAQNSKKSMDIEEENFSSNEVAVESSEIIPEKIVKHDSGQNPIQEEQVIIKKEVDATDTSSATVNGEMADKTIRVVYMAFGRKLIVRDIVDVDTLFSLSDKRIYCMTKIQNRNYKKVIFHKWYHEGKLRSNIRMEVGQSYNWRTWSYIDVRPNIIGHWQVFVSDSLGVNYDSLSFQVQNSTVE